MKLIRCDRCRKELAVDDGQGLHEVPGYVPVTVGATPMTLSSGKIYDLCAPCGDATTRFLTTEPPQAARSTS